MVAATCGESEELFLSEVFCGSDACAAVGGRSSYVGSCVRVDGCSVAYSTCMVSLREQKINLYHLMNIEENISPRSRTVTLILACLLFCSCCGGLHRIYTGKIISGVLQILTGGGFVIWQVIDIIRILLGSFDDAQGRDIAEW